MLSYTDSAGKRRQSWIGTGLPVKGNKKRAEKMLADTRKDFTISKGQVSELSPDMAFSDYMRYWLKMMRTAVTETTYSSYCFNVEKHIIPYFELLGVTLAGLQPRQIQSFYLHEAETLKKYLYPAIPRQSSQGAEIRRAHRPDSQQPGGQGGPPKAAGVHGKLLQRRGNGKAL